MTEHFIEDLDESDDVEMESRENPALTFPDGVIMM